MSVKFLLYCPECASDERLTVQGKNKSVYDYPCILNCPRCGKFEIDKIKPIKEIEK